MKIFTGRVIHKKMAKTATVEVDRVMMHPVYKKRYKQSQKYHVHDDMGAKIGDEINFVATKPYSKTKKWKIVEIVSGDLPEKKKKSKKDKKKKSKSAKK